VIYENNDVRIHKKLKETQGVLLIKFKRFKSWQFFNYL